MTASDGARVLISTYPQSLADDAARRMVKMANESISRSGVFRVALSGGTTPKRLFERLASNYADALPWQHVQIFFSDERFVPPDSPESNYHTAWEGLLSHVPIPAANIFPVPTVDIEPDEAAEQYQQEICSAFGTPSGSTPRFPLILLGLGPDGHTASLFPDTKGLSITDRLVAPNFVEKLNAWRITFTYSLINAGERVVFLAEGEGKKERVGQVLSGQQDLPASHVRPTDGSLEWWIDESAAGQIPSNVSKSHGE